MSRTDPSIGKSFILYHFLTGLEQRFVFVFFLGLHTILSPV